MLRASHSHHLQMKSRSWRGRWHSLGRIKVSVTLADAMRTIFFLYREKQ